MERTPRSVGIPSAVFLASLGILDGAARAGGGTFLLAVAVTAGATAVSVVVSGWMQLGQLSGPIAAGAGACLLLVRWIPVAPAGAVVVVGTLLAGIRLDGLQYSDLPLPAALLLAAAPLGAWIPARALGAQPKPRAVLAIRTLAVALLAGAAVAIAAHESPPMGY